MIIMNKTQKQTQAMKFEIASESRAMNHTVEFIDGEWKCTCEHHKFRGAECKHIKQAKAQLGAVAETGDATITNVSVEVVDITAFASLKKLLTLKKELNNEDVDLSKCKSLVEDLLLEI